MFFLLFIFLDEFSKLKSAFIANCSARRVWLARTQSNCCKKSIHKESAGSSRNYGTSEPLSQTRCLQEGVDKLCFLCPHVSPQVSWMCVRSTSRFGEMISAWTWGDTNALLHRFHFFFAHVLGRHSCLERSSVNAETSHVLFLDTSSWWWNGETIKFCEPRTLLREKTSFFLAHRVLGGYTPSVDLVFWLKLAILHSWTNLNHN